MKLFFTQKALFIAIGFEVGVKRMREKSHNLLSNANESQTISQMKIHNICQQIGEVPKKCTCNGKPL